jgi:hypothetical protein
MVFDDLVSCSHIFLTFNLKPKNRIKPKGSKFHGSQRGHSFLFSPIGGKDANLKDLSNFFFLL